VRDLAEIFKMYRRANRLSQRQLAALLDFDPSYISLLERRLRRPSDRGTLAHISRRLSIPRHVLGITEDDDGDFAAMVQFADSTIRLAEIARQTGRVTDAVRELWPLVALLEARVCDGRADRDVLVLLAQARLALGAALGNMLPDERLFVAARWTSKALSLAGLAGDRTLYARTLRMHGNELRKADRCFAAVARLSHALQLSDDPVTRGETLVLLARAAGEVGHTELFDVAIEGCRRLLDSCGWHTPLFNPFSVREVVLRGLMATGRAEVAVAMASGAGAGSPDIVVAPQWLVIERVTIGQVLLAGGESAGAAEALRDAVTAAEAYGLPHQIQRAVRVADSSATDTARAVVEFGTAALERLRRSLTVPMEGATRPGSSDR
jgi:transcriptional regulator with XRE-family HTH domain